MRQLFSAAYPHPLRLGYAPSDNSERSDRELPGTRVGVSLYAKSIDLRSCANDALLILRISRVMVVVSTRRKLVGCPEGYLPRYI